VQIAQYLDLRVHKDLMVSKGLKEHQVHRDLLLRE
jgi:hypothetical protein